MPSNRSAGLIRGQRIARGGQLRRDQFDIALMCRHHGGEVGMQIAVANRRQ